MLKKTYSSVYLILLNGGVPLTTYQIEPMKYKLKLDNYQPFLNIYNIIIHMQNTMINPWLYYCISTLVN